MVELEAIIVGVAEAHDAEKCGILDEMTPFRMFEFVNKLHELLPKPAPASIIHDDFVADIMNTTLGLN